MPEDNSIEYVKMQFQTHMEEYKMLRTEILKRHDFLNNNINFTIVLLVGITAALFSLYTKTNDPDFVIVIQYALLFATIPFYAFGCFHAVNIFLLVSVDKYIYEELKPKITALLKSNEDALFGFQKLILRRCSTRKKQQRHLAGSFLLTGH